MIGKIAYIIFLIYAYLSVLIWLWVTFKKPGFFDSNPPGHPFTLYLGVLLGLSLFHFSAFEGVFFFIPDSWVFLDDAGDISSIKGLFSCICSVLYSMAIMALVEAFRLNVLFPKKE